MPLLFLGGSLIGVGLILLYSAGVYESFDTSLDLGLQPSNYFWFNKQLINLLISMFVGFIVYLIPLKFIRRNVGLIFVGSLILQLLVFTPLGVSLNGARGRIDIPGLPSIQPVEFFKIGRVLFLSAWLVKKKPELNTVVGYMKFLVLMGLFSLVFLLIPDLGSLLIIVASSLILYWYQGGRGRFIFIAILLASIFVVTIGRQFSYVRERIDSFVSYDISNKESEAFQIWNALVAIGSGGFRGRGYGNGLQKFRNIPETYSDFIFAASAEEIGFIGSFLLLGLYFSFMYVCFRRFSAVDDPFYKNVAIGLTVLIIVQMFVNIAVNTKLMPITGLTLPFISYGGSSLMASIITLILLYKILYRENTGSRTG